MNGPMMDAGEKYIDLDKGTHTVLCTHLSSPA